MACSRAQIVQILYNLSGDKTDYGNYYLPFTDVAPGDWFYEAVAWAYANDIVAGTSASTFAPNDVITREQMAVILYGYTAKFAPEFTGNAASLNTFPRRRQRRQLGLCRHVVGRGQWPDLRHGDPAVCPTSRRRAAPRARRPRPSSCATASSSASEPARKLHHHPPREPNAPGAFCARSQRPPGRKCAAAADTCARPAEAGTGDGKRLNVNITSLIALHLC